MLAKVLREQPEVGGALMEFTEPYGTIASAGRIAEGNADAFDYLAAVPVLGLPARVAGKSETLIKAINKLMAMGYPMETAEKIATGKLPMDYASRMKRMKDQGWTIEGYHTGSPNIRGMDPSLDPTGPNKRTHSFIAKDPVVSNTYHNEKLNTATYPMVIRDEGNVGVLDAQGADWDDLRGKPFTDSRGNIHPLEPTYSEYADTSDAYLLGDSLGDDVVVIKNVTDHADNLAAARHTGDMRSYEQTMEHLRTPSDIVATSRPMRSKLAAAFDPDMLNSHNILASLTALPTTALIAALLRQQTEQEEPAL